MFRDRNSSEFQDHSTLSGKLSLFFSRINWKYVPGAALMISLVLVGLLVASARDNTNPESLTSLGDNSSGLETSETQGQLLLQTGILRKSPKHQNPFEPNPWNPNKVTPPGVFESEGCENGLMNFEGFGNLSDKASMKSLKLRDLIIDAPKLSRELQGWINLESIVIENAWISGEFSRVFLPKLNKFIFHQFHNEKTDTYKLPEKLKSILFFDKIEGQTWSLEKDVLNINVTIQVTIGGTKILKIEPEFGDILINTHYCEDIFENYISTFPTSALSFHWCPITNVTISKLPTSIQFLQFNNAVPSTEDLTMIFDSLDQLKELHIFNRFHCDWPGYEIYLNVSELPKSVETLSMTNLDISFAPGLSSMVKNLSIANYISEGFVEHFETTFANLGTVALFNLSAEDAYPLLQKVLKTQTQWIVVTNLTRSGISPIEKEIESFLMGVGVPATQPCFIIEKTQSGNYSGRSLTPFERNYYRYTRLAFDKIDTYEDYMTWDADPRP